MTRLVVNILLCYCLIGCEHGQQPVLPPLVGDYAGTFTIISEDGGTQSGGIIFGFFQTRYRTVPEKPYLPPSGAGNFTLNGRILHLTDTVAHTAEFDWTLILEGDFNYSSNGDKITLTQDDIRYHRHRTIELTYDR